MGSFGLGASSGNFTYVTPKPLYTQLQDEGEILGAGYGYTAGAVYREFLTSIPVSFGQIR